MHSWDVTAMEAVAIQKRLRALVRRENDLPPGGVRTIAGVNASYGEPAHADAVLMTFPELQINESARAEATSPFPYIPGLLSFREAPLAIAALERLHVRPDLLLCHAQGYAHPRRFGLACHLGVYLDLPAIGCAKTRLVGTHDEPGTRQPDRPRDRRRRRAALPPRLPPPRAYPCRGSRGRGALAHGHLARVRAACRRPPAAP
jgi:deoxyribonuclease V